jgi:hypothetical protein
MHRRKLILRRFGALTFGLGYFEDGEWVDHTALPDRGRDITIAGAETVDDRSAIHELLSCCDSVTASVAGEAEAIPIGSDLASSVRVITHTDTDVDAVARRSSAL